jgi:hypothetical protein
MRDTICCRCSTVLVWQVGTVLILTAMAAWAGQHLLSWRSIARPRSHEIGRKIIIVLLTAAALTTGLIANAFAFSGGVSHPVSHPASMAAGTATGLGTDVRHHRRRHHVAAQVRPRPHH